MSITVLLVDDHTLFRESLRALIADTPGLDIIGDANDGESAIAETARLKPNVAILDISMPGMNGVEACKRIRKANSATRILALSMHDATHFVRAMLGAGAHGYLLKDTSAADLVRAIHAVHTGATYLSPAIAGQVLQGFLHTRSDAEPSVYERLTERECEVLRGVVEGMTLTDVARRLGRSVKTIHACRARIMQKLNLNSVAALTKYAVREGLTEL